MKYRPSLSRLRFGFFALLVIGSLAYNDGLSKDKELADSTASPVKVTHIFFDHSSMGDEYPSALPLRKSRITPIPKPEWVRDERSEDALFVQNRDVVILARFEAPLTIASATLWAESDGPLGNVIGRRVRFSNGVSNPEYVAFSTQYAVPSGMGIHTWNWQWKSAYICEGHAHGQMDSPKRGGTVPKYNGENDPKGIPQVHAEKEKIFVEAESPNIADMNVSGEHRIYTILDDPGMPWVIDTPSNHNPWTSALDVAFANFEGTTIEEMLDSTTRFCYDHPCFKYDIVSGSPCYIAGSWVFNLSLVISDINTGHKPRIGCCYDGGAIVHSFGNLLGAQTHFVLSGSPYTSGYFGYLNCIDPIGRGEEYCNNPFHDNSSYRQDPLVYQDGSYYSCGRSSFGNHAFAGSQPGSSGVIWDATMCADVDANPDTSVVFPPTGGITSTGMTATTLTDSTQNWTPDQWAGMRLNPNTGGNYPDPYLEYVITGNTETVITVESGSNLLQSASAGDKYWIRDPANPDADIIYLTGFPWSEFAGIAVDDSTPNPPVERIISLL